MRFLNHEAVLNILPDRDENAHKGDFGKVLLLCGSRGYTGAAALAAMGALRSGAGLVYLGVPESIYAIEAWKLTANSVPTRCGKYRSCCQKWMLCLSAAALDKVRGPGRWCVGFWKRFRDLWWWMPTA